MKNTLLLFYGLVFVSCALVRAQDDSSVKQERHHGFLGQCAREVEIGFNEIRQFARGDVPPADVREKMECFGACLLQKINEASANDMIPEACASEAAKFTGSCDTAGDFIRCAIRERQNRGGFFNRFRNSDDPTPPAEENAEE